MVGQSREMLSLFCIGFQHTHHREFCRVCAELVEAFVHVPHALFLTGSTTPIGMLHAAKGSQKIMLQIGTSAARCIAFACAEGTKHGAWVPLRKAAGM